MSGPVQSHYFPPISKYSSALTLCQTRSACPDTHRYSSHKHHCCSFISLLFCCSWTVKFAAISLEIKKSLLNDNVCLRSCVCFELKFVPGHMHGKVNSTWRQVASQFTIHSCINFVCHLTVAVEILWIFCISCTIGCCRTEPPQFPS